MNSSTLLGALALASIFVAGCRDDRALGAERSRATPQQMPPANDHRPLDEAPPVPGTSDPMATTQSSPRTPTGWIDDSVISTSDRAPEVMNGEDLGSIPDLREPIWATGASVETYGTTNGTGVDTETECPTNPADPARSESTEPVPH